MQLFRKSLLGSIKRNVNSRPDLRHRQNLNPGLDQIQEKPVRASDVPLFTEADVDHLGISLRKTYNHCINLTSYRPEEELEEELRLYLVELEEQAIEQMKALKKKKKDYSNVWKEHFGDYIYSKADTPAPTIPDDESIVELHDKIEYIEYDDSDPYDNRWMTHKDLASSIEMQAAAQSYFEEAKKALKELKKIRKAIKIALRPVLAERNINAKNWFKLGQKQNRDRLTVIQEQVDQILHKHWTGVKKYLKGEFKGLYPSYIGSTHTGHKSITKAYIQFNPNDYDVDGQLVSTALYTAITHHWQKASKERLFVRNAAEPVANAIKVILAEKKYAMLKPGPGITPEMIENSKKKLTSKAKNNLTRLKNIMESLLVYVDKVEDDLIELDGVEEDPNDRFDLAIVRERPVDPPTVTTDQENIENDGEMTDDEDENDTGPKN